MADDTMVRSNCYIDLTYSQFKKYQKLIKEDRDKFKQEVSFHKR